MVSPAQIMNMPRRRLRVRLNPLEVFNDREFLARYRFTKATVASLLESLSLEECASNRGLPVPPMLQLLIALRFYGAGTFQVVTGDLVAVSQPTVCRVVERVSRLIAGTLFRRLVKFPSTATDFDRVMLEFYALKKFPGAITGPQLQFYDIVASWPGSVHDSRIFDNSRARVLYEHQRVPGVLLGDAGYACTTYLMTPLATPGAAKSPEERYQKAHIRTRNSVERAFGVWKRQFPCLDMRLQHKPERSAVIITACAALHNLARLRNDPCPPPMPAPPVPPQRRRRQPHLPPTPDPVDTINGAWKRAQIISRSFT
ncbi:hypothetical protein HPB47_014647 [Ixodes persulcatus]|uniref:Uncharacterized protein n=1 Tax=Ixodes persulcatus TaxID=34615 RepID=A0AC60R0N6_IXOPE|nr:hypothetical protein HPB47_014647 [Ixodes persulcatus]